MSATERLLDERIATGIVVLLSAGHAWATQTGSAQLGIATLDLLPAALLHLALVFGGAPPALRLAPSAVLVPYAWCGATALVELRSIDVFPTAVSAAASVTRAILVLAALVLAVQLARAGLDPSSTARLRAAAILVGLVAAGIALVAHRWIGHADSALPSWVLAASLAASLALDRGADAGTRRASGLPDPTSAFATVARGIAHAMVKPLGAARERLEFAAPRISDAALRDEVERAGETLAHMQRLVRDLLDLARAQGISQRRPIALADVVAQAVAEVRGRLPGARIELDPIQGSVFGDELGLRCLVVNLVENAAEAAGGAGWVRVSGCPEAGSPGLSVEDRSGGIDPSILDRLFEPFATTKPLGTGLGLAVVREVCRAHQGHVRMEATERGTRFIVVLPTA